MALLDCSECAAKISSKASVCPGCGCPMSDGSAVPRITANTDLATLFPTEFIVTYPATRRGVYVALGLSPLGVLGFHNYYAGRISSGVWKGLLTVFLGWTVIGLIAVIIWVIYELVNETEDGRGLKMM